MNAKKKVSKLADAFTDELFKGNPAGICVLDSPIEERMMQMIAYENNLPETAFLLKRDGYYDLRWFRLSSRSICYKCAGRSGFNVP